MKKLLIISIIVLGSTPVFSQWFEVPGHENFSVRNIYHSESEIFADGFEGVFWLAKDKFRWKQIDFPDSIAPRNLLYVDNSLFIRTLRDLYYTSDLGKSWEIEQFGLGDKCNVNSIMEYNENLLVRIGDSLYKYNIVNKSFFVVNEKMKANRMYISGDTILFTTNTQHDPPNFGACVWISYDGGTTISDITTDNIGVKTLFDGYIYEDKYIIAGSDGLYMSPRDEIKWTRVEHSKLTAPWRIEAEDSTLYVLNANGYLFYSTDTGETWDYNVSFGVGPKYFTVSDLCVTGDSVFVSTDQGVFLTNDQGSTWSELNTGFSAYGISDIEIDNEQMYISTYYNGVKVKNTHSDKWEKLPGDTAVSAIPRLNSICKSGDTVFTGGYIGGYLQRSTDFGNSWEKFAPGLPRAYYSFLKQHENYLFTGLATGGRGLYKVNKESGAVDTMMFSKPGEETPEYYLYIKDFAAENDLYLAASNDKLGYGLYKSDDAGENWSPVILDSTDKLFYSVAIEDGVCYAGSGTGKLYASYDKGEKWDLLFESRIDSSCIKHIRPNEQSVYFSVHGLKMSNYTDSCGLYRYNINSGKVGFVNIGGTRAWRNWIRDMEFFGDSLFVVTPKMLYKAGLDFLKTVSVEEVESPSNYLYVSKVYPLPAREEVKAEIYWDKKLDILMSDFDVYDFDGSRICGRERLKIEKNSDWSGVVTWDASGVPPGIYFLYIRHGDRSKAVKMLVE